MDLIANLADRHHWIMFELDIGGFGAVQAKALEAARAVTANRWLTDEERKALRSRDPDWEAYVDEAASERDQVDDDE